MQIRKVHRGNTTVVTLGVALALATSLAVGSARAETSEEHIGRLEPDGTLQVENIVGTISVSGWDGDQVRLTAVLSDEVKDLEFDVDGGRGEIRVVYPRHRKNLRHGADLEIMVPHGIDLEVESVSADITVVGVDGAVYASSVSGDVEIAGPAGRIQAESISGDVFVRDGGREVDVESISGSVKLDGSRGEVQAQTVSGRIEVTYDLLLDLEVESVSGSAWIRGDLDGGGSYAIDLHSGDLELTVPADVDADFSIETFSGDIDTDFAADVRRTSKYTPGKECDFRAGSGAASVRISSFSGSVAVLRR